MPKIGEIQKGKDIGKTHYITYQWLACMNCGKERWVRFYKMKPQHQRCYPCCRKSIRYLRGRDCPAWTGGRNVDKYGYVNILLQPDDFFFPMVNSRGYVKEHRLVVAKALGRNLHLWEIVHHKKGYAKDDNRYPETLQLVTDDRHKQITILENRISLLEKRLTLLEAENILLREKVYV